MKPGWEIVNREYRYRCDEGRECRKSLLWPELPDGGDDPVVGRGQGNVPCPQLRLTYATHAHFRAGVLNSVFYGYHLLETGYRPGATGTASKEEIYSNAVA